MRGIVFRSVAVIVISITLHGSEARAGCGSNGCPWESVNDVWRQHPDDPGYFGLYRDGVQIAGYDTRSGIYRTYDPLVRAWGPPQRAPWKKDCCACVPGCSCDDGCSCSGGKRCTDECTCVATEVGRIPNYGVDLSRLNGKHEVLTLNGRSIPKERAAEILSGGQLVDDSGKPHLTIIGSDSERRQVLDDLSRPPLADWKERLLVQSYPPNHWTVTRSGFFGGGHPTIYLQTPSGAVLHRQDDYEDGAEGLMQAIRRADPNYDPKRDLDLRRLLGLPNPLSKIPVAAWLLAGGVLFGLLQKGQP